MLEFSAVLLFDANIAGPLPCRSRHRCSRPTSTHLCRHRFGPEDTLILSACWPVQKSKTSDLRVAEFFIGLALGRIHGASIVHTRWIIVTRDKGFCGAAQREYRLLCKKGVSLRHALQFDNRTKTIGVPLHGLRIEVVRMSSKKYGTGKIPDLRRAAEKVAELLSQPRA